MSCYLGVLSPLRGLMLSSKLLQLALSDSHLLVRHPHTWPPPKLSIKPQRAMYTIPRLGSMRDSEKPNVPELPFKRRY